MGSRTPTMEDIAQEILTCGVICLTGGHDVASNTLLTFPTSAHPHLEFWSSERLMQLLRHYVQWLAVTSEAHTVACLADLQNASKDVINVIVEAVEKLEVSSRGTVNTVYFLKPLNKSRCKLLKKLLGLKPSKKHPKIPLFKVVLMKNHQEMFNQIDLCQLTSDFGGTLTYDHLAWLRFHETVAPCIREAENVVRKMPDLKDRVELLQDYDIHTSTVTGIQQLLNELAESYQHTISEARFQETLDHLKQTLLVLDSTEASEQWLTRVHAPHVKQATERVRQLYTHLEGERLRLEELWRGTEDSLTVHLQIQRHRERAAEIEKRMKTHYEPLLQEHPSVGNTLSQAELYRTHFTTTLYEPSKELLSQATEILEDVQRLRERLSVHSTPQCDVTDILARLTVALQPFTHRLQSLQDIYVAVHIFHLLFQKALTWYRKVLKFLPEGLETRAESKEEQFAPEETTHTCMANSSNNVTSSSRSSSGTSKVVQMPVEWQMAVQSFLNKHPPPREHHLARLDTEIPPQVEKRLKVQARSLALRLRLLQRLLYSRRLPVKLLSTIFRWRAEVMNSSSSAGSTPQPKSPKRVVNTREEVSVLTTTHRPDPSVPPPKPVRTFDTMTSVSSLSSSDAGDSDYFNMTFLDHPGTGLTDSFSVLPTDLHDKPPAKPLKGKLSEDIVRYQNPPKVDIKIMTSHHESDSNNSNCPEYRTSDRSASSDQKRVSQPTPEEERFIRLTFSPSASSNSRRSNSTDDSFDSEELAFRFHDAQTGSESGIEVAETDDPWDSIIDRIKAVSNSNLPSDVKIQCMSHLLSRSKVADPSTRQKETSSYPIQNLQQQNRSEGVSGKDVGFDQFQHRIGLSQDPDVHRHQSFAIAREDVRPYHRHGQDRMLTSTTQTGLYNRGAMPDRWTTATDRADHLDKLRLNELEKPSMAVARMRHRLARSLMDLDEIDHFSGPEDFSTNIRQKNPQPDRPRSLQPSNQPRVYANRSHCDVIGPVPKVVSVNSTSKSQQQEAQLVLPDQDRPWRKRATDSLTKSHEGGLDAAHLSKPHDVSSKLVAWRSHEDGLDSLTRQPLLSEMPLSKMSSGSMDSGLDPTKSLFHHQRVLHPSASPRKNPYRWRQGIMEEHMAYPVKERKKSKDFIAPSFLKPFHSMCNLHEDTDYLAHFNLFSQSRHRDRTNGVRGHCSEDQGQGQAEVDSLSDSSRRGHRRLSLDRLSDEMEQEYLSQDEVHSSLQRSQRILMEAEEKIRLHAQARDATQTYDPKGADDTMAPIRTPVAATQQPGQPSCSPSQRNQPDGHETHAKAYETMLMHVAKSQEKTGEYKWEYSSTVASVSPDQEDMTSRSMAGDAEFDADVSNMSDSYMDQINKT